MFKKYYYIIVIGVFLLLQSCGASLHIEERERPFLTQEEHYKPYKLQHTIEGYKEFIAKYPGNIFIEEAKMWIDYLEFAPYEQADSIEGYMEFKMKYPNNRYIFKANARIEQVELKHYEKIDTIEGYKEFLSKYPESNFAVLAKERLQ